MSYISVGSITRDHRGTSSPDDVERYEKECRDAGVHDSRISTCVSARKVGMTLSSVRRQVSSGDWGDPRSTDRHRKSGTAYKGDAVVDSRSDEEKAALERIRKARAKKLERLRKAQTCRYPPDAIIKNWRTGKGFVADKDGCPVDSPDVTDQMQKTVEEKGHPAERGEEVLDPDSMPTLGGGGGLPPWVLWGGAAAGAGLLVFLIARRR